MKIKEFKNIFIESVSNKIHKQGFTYKKSRDVFEYINGEHIFYVFVYMYKRSTFIEIDTKAYYGNINTFKELKKLGISLPSKKICGGGIKFICNYYFNREFPEKYDNLIFMLNENPNHVIQNWLGYFDSIINPFFGDCKNPKLLNEIVNNIPIDKTGLNATYQTRVYYSCFTGKKTGIENERLLELMRLYECELKKWGDDCDYINEFLHLKKEFFK